jgi:hypothetical protein
MIAEGVLCLFDGPYPAPVRDRLNCFLRPEEQDAECAWEKLVALYKTALA